MTLEQPIKVELMHDNAAYAGMLWFDGEVFEAFGFGEQHAIRVPVELMRVVKLSLERGMLTDPNLTIEGRGGSYGWGSNLQPEPAQEAELQALAAEIEAAIERRGPR